MDEDRRGALLGNELERRRELHAERLLGGEELEELSVILEVGTGAVAPRVALASPTRDAELAADAAMQPLGHGFGGFHGEAMRVEALAVFACGLERFEAPRGVVAHGDDLERHD